MDDLISRQAAIDALTPIHKSASLRNRNVFSTARKCMAAIEELPPEQKWIPCSERMPENEDIYLVTFDKSNLLDNETQVTDAYWINNQWQYSVLESYEHRMPKLVVEPIEELKVIAWMPLQKPYKEENDEIQ